MSCMLCCLPSASLFAQVQVINLSICKHGVSGSRLYRYHNGNAGVGEVIKGWDRGVAGMRVGDKRKLTVPPQMGYGSDGVKGAIPPNATLLFNVELVDVK